MKCCSRRKRFSSLSPDISVLLILALVSSTSVVLSQETAVVSNSQQTVGGGQDDLAQRPGEGDVRQRPGQGGLGGLLSGFLGQITQTADVDECPGKCIHALASLICDEVREDIQCPSANMRCCVERDSKKPPKKKGQNSRPDTTTRATTKVTTTTTTTTTTKRTTTTTERLPATNKLEKFDDEDSNITIEDLQATESKSCPGVCVAERLSNFCEAILNMDGLCKSGLKCCVAKQIFDGKNPPELVIPGGNSNSGSGTSSVVIVRKEQPKEDEEDVDEKKEKKKNEEDEKDSTKCKGTCVTGFFALLCDEIDVKAQCPSGSRCCVSQRDKKRPPPARRPQKKPDRQCPGVCIPQAMSSVCTIVPNTNSCQKGTVCCSAKDQQQEQKENNNDNNRVPPKRKPPPRRPPGGNGPDLTNMMGTLLNAATGNSGTGSAVAALWPVLGPAVGSLLLGGGGGGNGPPSNGAPNGDPANNGPSSLASSVLPAVLGTLLGGGNGGGSGRPPPPPPPPPYRRPPPPPYRQPPPSRPDNPTRQQPTTTPPPAERRDDRPPCNGSCIGTNFAFVCFGSATLSDLFSCPENKRCCAKKSDIRERELELKRLEREQNNNIIYSTARNDTVTNINDLESGFYNTPPPKRPTIEHPVTNKYVCGVKGTYRSGRVVGGEDGTPGEWCWQVALINSLNQYLCGGALIGTQWVLTAAHCVTNIVRAGDAIYVRVGDHDLTQKFGSPGAQTLRVATTYIHHNHNSQTLDNDIALLKLHGEADLKEGVCLVCLPARGTSQQAGKVCTVTGYGYMGETGPIPLRVREAPVPVVNDNECVRKINAVTEKIFILPASSFCAGGVQGHDACQGDGGGPLVCEDQGYYELTGLVSWGFGCGREDVPGVYVKVSSFIGWINQIISVNNL